MYNYKIIAYIDILGFQNEINKRTVSDNKENENETTRVYDFISLINKDFVDKKRKKLIETTYEVTQFSDSLVISYLFNEKASVFQILLSLLFLHIDAIMCGFLIRGAVTAGLLVHDDDHIFGPAMNIAHKVEDEISIYPRIIVDKALLDIAYNNPLHENGQESELDCIEELLKIDFDGFYYLDYLNQGCELVMEEYGYEGLPDYFQAIAKIIDDNKNEDNLRVVQKYNWLKGKYNSALKKYKDFGLNSDAYNKVVSENLGEQRDFINTFSKKSK